MFACATLLELLQNVIEVEAPGLLLWRVSLLLLRGHGKGQRQQRRRHQLDGPFKKFLHGYSFQSENISIYRATTKPGLIQIKGPSPAQRYCGNCKTRIGPWSYSRRVHGLHQNDAAANNVGPPNL